MTDPEPLTYAESGVSLDAADAVVDRIRSAVASTHSREVLGQPRRLRRAVRAERGRPADLGGVRRGRHQGAAGSGAGRLHGLGIDLVAMSVNDVITSGGRRRSSWM